MDALNRFMRDLAEVVRIPPPRRALVDVEAIIRDIAALVKPELTDRRTKRDGRGLGLTVVQEILTNHGFAYALENRTEGGAEFRIFWGT